MKLIPLGGKHGAGKFAQVDDEDYDKLIIRKWYAQKNKFGTVWAVSEIKGKKVQMHRIIMNELNKNIVIDHRDRNRLNNQKNNLRQATITQNTRNTTSRINSSSKFLGVCKKTYNKNLPGRVTQIRYLSSICVNGIKKELGLFPYTPCGELLAAINYDIAAEKYFGEFANLNFKPLWLHT